MITGDSKNVANKIGQKVGIDKIFAEVKSEEKKQIIQNLQREGKLVGAIGDGINDAPMLAQSDVGFAIGTGTDIAIETSDVTLVGRNLKVSKAIEISKKNNFKYQTKSVLGLHLQYIVNTHSGWCPLPLP